MRQNTYTLELEGLTKSGGKKIPVTATTWQLVMTACHDDTAFRSQVIECTDTQQNKPF